MKIKLTLIFTLVLCIILAANACTERQIASNTTHVPALQSDVSQIPPTPDPTPTTTAKLTPEPTPEPTELGLWARLIAEGFVSVDDYSYSDLIDALYAVDGEAQITERMTELGFSSIYDYLFYRIQEEKQANYAQQETLEPTKSIDDMSLYERAYYYATPEQRKRLENMKKPWGDGIFEYTRQIREIMGEIDENLPRLTLEQARAICNEAAVSRDSLIDSIALAFGEFYKIAGAQDAFGGSGTTAYYFFLDDEGKAFIRVSIAGISYRDDIANISERLLP